MNVFVLKIIALVTMFASSASAAFGNGGAALRAAGGFAFVLYAFLMAEGFRHYRGDKKRTLYHFIRLTVLMIASEFCYDFFMTGKAIDWTNQSVMPVLWLGLVGLMLTEQFKNDEQMYVLVIYSVCAYITYVLATEFRIGGVLLIFAFFWIQEMAEEKDFAKGKKVLWMLLAAAVLSSLTLWATAGFGPVAGLGAILSDGMPLLIGSVVALLPLALYGGQVGFKNRPLNEVYAWMYPAHLLLLGFLMNR